MKFVLTLCISFCFLNSFAQSFQIVAVPTIYLDKKHGFPIITGDEYKAVIDSSVLNLSYWYVENGFVPKSWDRNVYILKPNQPIIFIKVSELLHQDSLYVYSTITRRFQEKPWNALKSRDSVHYRKLKPYFDSLYTVNRKPPRQPGGDSYNPLLNELWLEQFDAERLLDETIHYLSIPCSFRSTPPGGKVYLIPSLYLNQTNSLAELNKFEDSKLNYSILYKLIPNLNDFLITNDTPIEEIFLPEFEYQIILELNNKFKKRFFTPQMNNKANNNVNF